MYSVLQKSRGNFTKVSQHFGEKPKDFRDPQCLDLCWPKKKKNHFESCRNPSQILLFSSSIKLNQTKFLCFHQDGRGYVFELITTFFNTSYKTNSCSSQKKQSYEVAPEQLAGYFAPLRIDLYLFIYLFMAYFMNKTAASITPCISKGASYP